MRYLILPVLLLAIGCGHQSSPMAEKVSMMGRPAADEAAGKFEGRGEFAAGGKVAEADKPADRRKMVYKATLHLVVEDFARTRTAVTEQVSKAGGHIENHSVDRSYGDRVQGDWILRVPVARFEPTLKALRDLGVPEFEQIDATDRTAQHVDLTARLKSQQALEARLIKLLDDRTDDLKTIIEVETKLASVRQTIEQIQGMLRTLNDQIALTTITLKAREQQNYTPPQAPTFATQISATFGNSIAALTTIGKAIVLCIVALTSVQR